MSVLYYIMTVLWFGSVVIYAIAKMDTPWWIPAMLSLLLALNALFEGRRLSKQEKNHEQETPPINN